MAIHIDQINVEKVGPISGLPLSLKRFNLIYGLNEQGKTFLVEFVIRSLFKNLSGWSLRDTDSRGKVVVSGLSESPIALTPSSDRKLEDYLTEEESGMPARISRLLVVKGADLSFEDGQRRAVSKEVLKEFLSGQGVLDVIEGNITSTVKQATFENGHIEGPNRGEIKSKNNLESDLKQIDGLFEQVEAIYSGGERQALQARVQELEAAITGQEAAKSRQAYQLDQSMRQKQEQIERLPQEDLDDLKANFSKLQETLMRISRQEVRLAELNRESEHYEWLEEAISLYEQRGSRGRTKMSPIFPVVIILALFLAIVSSFMSVPLGTVVLVIIAAIVGWLYVRQYRSAFENATDVDEIRKLEEEFQRRFGQPLSGLPQLREAKKAMEEAYHGAKALYGGLEEERVKLEDLRDQVTAEFQRLMDKIPDPEVWETEIKKLVDHRSQMQKQLNNYQVELAALGIPESEYRTEPTTIDYSPESHQAFQEELVQAKENLKEKTNDLDNLKQGVSATTRDEISIGWESLIQNLQHKREGIVTEYREVTAKVLAGILVNERLDVIRAQEEEKIQEKLASPKVSGPIHHITGRYSSVHYEGEKVWVTDDFGRFSLSDLSTGALEQVLLGLRIGFAAHTLGQDRLFLLLDDAFQHADWNRRPRLLDQTVTLAKEGWQIIYFTMDQHIKRLFDKAGQQHFPDQYMCHELYTENSSSLSIE
ncbi:MAG: hypothetical protein WA996_11240 [Candidatus Promineifilaceae bacterium]